MFYRKQVKYDYNASPGHYEKLGGRRKRRAPWYLGVGLAIACAVLLWDKPWSHGETGDVHAQLKSEPGLVELQLPANSRPVTTRDAGAEKLPFEPRVPVVTTNSVGTELSDADATVEWTHVSVMPGDNLSLIFNRLGLSKRDLHGILQSGKDANSLKRIKPGQSIRLRAKDGHVLDMIYDFDYRRSLHVTLVDDHYNTETIEVEPDIRTATAVAVINNSLFVAGQRTGLSDKLIMQLTEIFGWDIDFALDIRKGDHFSVIYEEIYKDGKKITDGNIYAAEFFNRNRRLRAIRYLSEQGQPGYYSDTGKAMRKAFLRTPVNFSRISSLFSLRRRHPVLNTIRAHKGVDYVAPYGTPIRSTADGKLIFAGTKGGYGKTVIIKHGKVYGTLYAHMSRFARGAISGAFIKQGQTIGYVGKTGLATGPHLHYEFLVNNVHHNPLTVKLPSASPIDKRYFADFKAKSRPLLAELDALIAEREKGENLVAGVDLGNVPATNLPISAPLN